MIKLTISVLFFNILITVLAQTVVIPATATKIEQEAGRELIKHLSKAVKRKISLKKEGDVFSGPAIYVGKTKFADRMGIKFDGFGKEEWLIKSFAKDLVVRGGYPRGTVYGVFELLERQFGILWLDERFTFIPAVAEIKWPKNLNLRGKPAFEVRGIYAYHRNPQKARRIFMARNRQNLFHDESHPEYLKRMGVFKIIGSPRACHTYYNYTKDWGTKNKDCFSLSSAGKRLRAVNGSGPGQVCMTNPKTRKLFSAKLRSFIKADRAKCPSGNYPLIYDISANDNNSKCVCPKCLAAAKKYGSYGGLVVEFTNAIADSIIRDYPDVKVQMFAYMFAQQVPKNIKARPNVLIRLAQLGSEFSAGSRDSLRPISHPNNKQSRQQVLGWSKIGSLAIWDYWIMFLKDIEASSCTAAITENLRFYRDQKVKSIFVESERPLNTCFYALRIWLGFRFMNNPDLKAAEQIDLFMKTYYGAAAPFMKAFLKYLEQRNSEIKDCLGNIPLKRRVDLDDAFFAKADELLKAAETAVVNKADYLRRIAKERAVIDYIRLSRRAELKPVEQKMVMERLEKNYRMACEDYLSENDAVQKAMNKLQIFFKGLQANIPVAEEFKESNVMVDLAWPQLKPHYHSKLIDVSDAAGGKAIVLKDKKHKGILQFGFYNVTDKKQVHNITIKRQLLPQDEKFHFYPIGKVTLSPKSYVWAHGSWEIQRKLSEFYESNGMPNDYEIFISIKVQGPAYVTGSKKQNAVMVDRILLIRPQQGESSPSGIQLPSELAKRKVAHDLTWQRLKAIPAHKVSMEPDADSAAKVALKLGNNMGIKHGILQYGLYDIVGKKMLSSRKVAKAKLAQDEKFHLYSLGKIKLSPSCYIWAHPSCRIQRNLKEFYQPDGDNNYEVFVSLKVQGPAYVPGSNKENAVLMDRILLVR